MTGLVLSACGGVFSWKKHRKCSMFVFWLQSSNANVVNIGIVLHISIRVPMSDPMSLLANKSTLIAEYFVIDDQSMSENLHEIRGNTASGDLTNNGNSDKSGRPWSSERSFRNDTRQIRRYFFILIWNCIIWSCFYRCFSTCWFSQEQPGQGLLHPKPPSIKRIILMVILPYWSKRTRIRMFSAISEVRKTHTDIFTSIWWFSVYSSKETFPRPPWETVKCILSFIGDGRAHFILWKPCISLMSRFPPNHFTNSSNHMRKMFIHCYRFIDSIEMRIRLVGTQSSTCMHFHLTGGSAKAVKRALNRNWKNLSIISEPAVTSLSFFDSLADVSAYSE